MFEVTVDAETVAAAVDGVVLGGVGDGRRAGVLDGVVMGEFLAGVDGAVVTGVSALDESFWAFFCLLLRDLPISGYQESVCMYELELKLLSEAS
jgi:hypothetical protein